MSKHDNYPEIDLVYLWVDGNDPAWKQKRDKFIGKPTADSAVNCDGRFVDNDELRFSLRAAERYAPWIRRIFIVTDGQIPAWLDTRNPRIRVVDHTEIMPPQCLPTFNSRAIEHSIYKIPGLAEHFIYANDDMFINRPVLPSDFFTPDGRPVVRFNRRPFRRLSLWLREKILRRPVSNYNKAIHRAALLVKKKYGKYFGAKTHHNIDAYNKSDYARVALEIFPREIAATVSNRVRTENDVQRNIYSYVAVAEKKARAVYVGRKTSFRFHIDNPGHYRKLEKAAPMLFCLNDSEYASPEDRHRVKDFLLDRFPEKSSFEI